METDVKTNDVPGVSKTKWLVVACAAAVLLVAVAGFGWQRWASPPDDLSGVWMVLGGNTTLVLEKQEDDYRLTLGGRRLTVKSVDIDRVRQQTVLSVVTDSGLLAVWTLHMGREGENTSMLFVNQDGFLEDAYVLQRSLTAVDRKRLGSAKAAKKPLWSPSFDCGRAATDVERMICSDRELAELDRRLADVIAESGEEDRALQRQWLENDRNSCKAFDCLRQIHLQRLEDLQRMQMNAAQYDESSDADAQESADDAEMAQAECEDCAG